MLPCGIDGARSLRRAGCRPFSPGLVRLLLPSHLVGRDRLGRRLRLTSPLRGRVRPGPRGGAGGLGPARRIRRAGSRRMGSIDQGQRFGQAQAGRRGQSGRGGARRRPFSGRGAALHQRSAFREADAIQDRGLFNRCSFGRLDDLTEAQPYAQTRRPAPGNGGHPQGRPDAGRVRQGTANRPSAFLQQSGPRPQTSQVTLRSTSGPGDSPCLSQVRSAGSWPFSR